MEPVEWRAFLEEEHTAVLGSGGGAPYPHLVAMWYLPDDEALLMWSYAKSQKVANLRRDSRVAVLVEAGTRYGELRGVLIQAEAEIINGFDSVLRAGLALHARYRDDTADEDPMQAEGSVRAQATKRVVIRVPYTRVISWDHRKLQPI